MRNRRKSNPVSQAIARQRLTAAIRDQKIALYLTPRGEKAHDLLVGIAMTLSLIGYAAELDPGISQDDPQLRILRGGLSACQHHVDIGWDPQNARAVDVALDAAADLKLRVNDRYIDKAFVVLTQS